MTGSGTIGDPYIIENVTDLQNIENDLTAYYELGGNIDASATTGWNGGAGFDPIILFTGQLDGKGFTISDLFINRPTESYVGLIGYINGNVVLKNIAMTGVDITGKSYVGALFGTAGSGDVLDIGNCSSAGSVTGVLDHIGGLIGDTWDGTIDDCYSSCTISGRVNVGGLIGYSIDMTITNCYATGTVTGSGVANSSVGGLIGKLWAGSLTKCYATGNASGIDWVGGLIGQIAQNPTISDCYARGNATAVDYYAGGFAEGIITLAPLMIVTLLVPQQVWVWWVAFVVKIMGQSLTASGIPKHLRMLQAMVELVKLQLR